MIDDERSHWQVKGPLGKTIELDARTTEMSPERGIGWNSDEGEWIPQDRCASRRLPRSAHA